MSVDKHPEVYGPDTSYPGDTYIVPPSDRVHIAETDMIKCLEKYSDGERQKTSWHTPLSILISLVLVPFTTNFKDFGLPGLDVLLLAITIVSALVVGIWLIRSISAALEKRKTAQEVVSELKERARAFSSRVNAGTATGSQAAPSPAPDVQHPSTQ